MFTHAYVGVVAAKRINYKHQEAPGLNLASAMHSSLTPLGGNSTDLLYNVVVRIIKPMQYSIHK